MVNKEAANNDKPGVFALGLSVCRHVFAVIFLLLLSTCKSDAQNIAKRFIRVLQPDGNLYFVLPQTNFRSQNARENFIMDIAFLDSKDSATVNFTFFDRDLLIPKTITMVYDNWQYQTSVKQIYAEPERRRWQYRYTFDIPFEQLILFNRASKPVITISTDSSPSISFHTVRRWKKNQEINMMIIRIIQTNQTIVNN